MYHLPRNKFGSNTFCEHINAMCPAETVQLKENAIFSTAVGINDNDNNSRKNKTRTTMEIVLYCT